VKFQERVEGQLQGGEKKSLNLFCTKDNRARETIKDGPEAVTGKPDEGGKKKKKIPWVNDGQAVDERKRRGIKWNPTGDFCRAKCMFRLWAVP